MNHINKPLGFNPMANSHHPQFGKHSHIAKLAQANEKNLPENVSLSERSAVAFKMVNQSISAKFSSVEGLDKNITEPKAEKSNVFDFEAVAKNVMSFITSSLSSAKSRGASASELEKMLGQARQGVNSGIDEAIEELGKLNVIDEELSEGIEQARDLINVGLDKTQEKLTEENYSSESNSSPVVSKAVELSSSKYTGQSNSSDLSITTADGDIVSISFSALKESQSHEYFNYNIGKNEKELSYHNNSSTHSSMNFSYSVQGELDDDELIAIQSLIENISKIENDFFSGNIDEAYNKALELGYDEQQLSSFNLELRQVKASYVSQTYSEIANYKETANKELTSVVKPVLDFIGDFKEIRDNANKILDQEGEEFNRLLQSVLNTQFDHNQELLSQFNKFIEKLL